MFRQLLPSKRLLTRRSPGVLNTVRYFSTTQRYAFEPVNKPPEKIKRVSSNPDYFQAFIAEMKEKRGPKLEKLKFNNTGTGETPSSIRRIPKEKLRAEVLVRREKIEASPTRLGPMCKLIRRMTVQEALDQLRYSPKKWSREMMILIHEGVQKAELEHGLGQDSLYIASCFVTRADITKGIIYHARGRFGISRKRKSHLNIILRDLAGQPVEKYALIERKLVKEKHMRQTPPNKMQEVLKHL